MSWESFAKQVRKQLGRTKSTRRLKRKLVLQLETLESRWLMAVNVRLANLPAATAGSGTGSVTLGTFHYTSGALTDNTATISWGDESAPTTGSISGTGGTGTITGSHTYHSAGAFTVSVTVSGTAGSGTATTGIIVVGAELSGSIVLDDPGEGVPLFAPVAEFTSANSSDTAGEFQAMIDWGDGHNSTGGIEAGEGDDFQVTGYHTYAVHGSYDVAVYVSGDGGSKLTMTDSITVEETPIAVSVFPYSFSPGTAYGVTAQPIQGLIATFYGGPLGSAEDFSATINWGDGTTSAGVIGGGAYDYDYYARYFGSAFGVFGNHTYSAAGDYTVTVTVTNSDETGYSTGSASIDYVSFFNPPPNPYLSISVTNFEVQQGQVYTGTVANFTDSSGAPTYGYTAWIDWGDGSGSWAGGGLEFGITASDEGYNVEGSHVYAIDGDYDVTVEVSSDVYYFSDFYGPASATGTATVTEAPTYDLTLQGRGVSQQTNVGSSLTDAKVVNFTAGNADAVAADFSAIINWGDGTTPSAGTVTAGEDGFQVNGDHEFSAVGSYLIHVEIEETFSALDTTVSTDAYSTATVVDGTLTPSGSSLTGTAGSAMSSAIVAGFTDTNPDSDPADFTATIYWGDSLTPTTGAISETDGNYVVRGSHTYAEPGLFYAETLIRSNGATIATAGAAVTVGPATLPTGTLQVEGNRLSEVEGLSFSNVEVAALIDLNPAHPTACHNVLIEWGDGSTSYGSFGVPVDGVVPIVGSHTYTAAGDYPLSIIVNYHELISATGYGSALIADRELSGSGATYYVGAGHYLQNLNLGVLTDANTLESASAFSATVYWGDGSTSKRVIS